MSDRQSQPLRKKRRSGSSKRRRERVISVRCHEHEAALIEANAAAVDLSPSAFLRAAGTGHQRPRERRPPLADAVLLTQNMAYVGRIGGNLAQLLKLANRGEFVAPDDLAPAVREARAFIANAQKALSG
jgi:hypothetical protein